MVEGKSSCSPRRKRSIRRWMLGFSWRWGSKRRGQGQDGGGERPVPAMGMQSLGSPPPGDRGCPYFGGEGRRDDGGDVKKVVVEGNLLGHVLPHGTHHHHVAVAVIHEALRVHGCRGTVPPPSHRSCPRLPPRHRVTPPGEDRHPQLGDRVPAGCSPCQRRGRRRDPAPGW